MDGKKLISFIFETTNTSYSIVKELKECLTKLGLNIKSIYKKNRGDYSYYECFLKTINEDVYYEPSYKRNPQEELKEKEKIVSKYLDEQIGDNAWHYLKYSGKVIEAGVRHKQKSFSQLLEDEWKEMSSEMVDLLSRAGFKYYVSNYNMYGCELVERN